VLQCVAVCCSVLQCVAACADIYQENFGARRCVPQQFGCLNFMHTHATHDQNDYAPRPFTYFALAPPSCLCVCVCLCVQERVCVAVCCSALQCVVVCYIVLQCDKDDYTCCPFAYFPLDSPPPACARVCVLHCVASCCSALQCVSVCCSALQCVAL